MGLSTVEVNTLAVGLAQLLAQANAMGAKEGQELNTFMQNPQRIIKGFKDIGDNAAYVHGPGGIFSSAGIENIVVNASLAPADLDPLLKAYPTLYTNPLYPVLTGFSEDTGDEPSAVCADCLGGTMQGGNLTAAFGHICRGSDEVNIMRTIQMINRGETTPLTLLGDVMGANAGVIRMPNTPTEWLEVTTKAEMIKVGVLLQRKVYKMTWSGTPANNTVGGGYKEFPGLELLVGTGKVDAETGTAMPAADSLVMDFGYTDIGSSDLGGNDIVSYVSTMEWYMRHVAERVGMMPVQWVFAGRPELWYELTAIWPCKYMSDRCTAANGTNVIAVNDERNVQLRDDMRNGMYLIVNGRKYPFVACDGITEMHGDPSKVNYSSHLASGEYASDLYFLPLAVRGGSMETLYWEYLDYSKADPQIQMLRAGNDFWTDGGRYFWTTQKQRGCFKINAEIDLRLILRTPHLAARLDNLRYTPLKHLRSPFALLGQETDPYFMKGGRSVRTSPADSWYSEWSRP